jgi:hypothetical protein
MAVEKFDARAAKRPGDAEPAATKNEKTLRQNPEKAK